MKNYINLIMRAKFIYEKFTDDDSDPIHDMGIGLTPEYWIPIKKKIWSTPFGELDDKYFKKFSNYNERSVLSDAVCEIINFLSLGLSPQRSFNKSFKILKIDQPTLINQKRREIVAEAIEKHFSLKVNPNFPGRKRIINEKFADENSDPIHDMGIGDILCPDCDGFGYTDEHDERAYDAETGEHDCSMGCPIQVQCETCSGTGYVNSNYKKRKKEAESIADDDYDLPF